MMPNNPAFIESALQNYAGTILTQAMREYGTEMNYQIGFDPEDDDMPYVNVMECGYAIAQFYYCSKTAGIAKKRFNQAAISKAAHLERIEVLRNLVDYYGRNPDVDNGLDELLTDARTVLANQSGDHDD
jgi:hypothetical protein